MIKAIGTPIAIQCRNGTRTPPNFSMNSMPRMLIELPAGVATPPISDATGMPIITALPNRDSPGRTSFSAKSPSAIAMKIAHAGTSDMMVEIAAVPTMNASRMRRLSVPARASRVSAKRRSSPEVWNAVEMQNMPSTKKSTGLIEAVNAARSSAMPRIGWRTRTSSAVTAIGIASVAHSTRATANSAAMCHPAAVRPAGGGISSSIAPTAIAARSPARRRRWNPPGDGWFKGGQSIAPSSAPPMASS